MVLTDLSTGSNFRSERIFKSCSDMWPSLRCHIIVDSSPFDATQASASCSISPLSMNKLALIFSAFINTSTPLTIFIIPFSTWVLYPWLSICSKDNIFFFRSLTCHTLPIVRIVSSNIFILIVPIPAISKTWSLPIYTNPPEIGSYVWNHSLWEVMCQLNPQSISQTSDSHFLPYEIVFASL